MTYVDVLPSVFSIHYQRKKSEKYRIQWCHKKIRILILGESLRYLRPLHRLNPFTNLQTWLNKNNDF